MVSAVRPAWVLVLAAAALASCDLRADGSIRQHQPFAQGAPPAPRAAVPVAALPGAATGPTDLPALVLRVEPAVVSITTSRVEEQPGESPPEGLFPSPGNVRHEHSLGAGFIISEDGLVVTNQHVIDGADHIDVRLFDERELVATVLGADSRLDVAVLELAGAHGLPVVSLGSSDGVRVGESVVAIGNPFGLENSVTFGIVSATAREIGAGPYDHFFQTDAAINPGSSGGPLFNTAGQVIGINTAVATHGEGIGFSIPIDDVTDVLPELERAGHVTRGRLGISFQEMNAKIAKALHLPSGGGAIVSELEPKSPADGAGIQPGDVITAIDGAPLGRAIELARRLGKHKPGDTIHLSLVHHGKAKTLEIRLDAVENEEAAADHHPPPADHPVPPGEGIRTSDAPRGGALVEGLEPGCPADGDLQPGDVVVEADGCEIKQAKDLTAKIAVASKPSSMLLRLRRESSYLYVAIDLR
jgi:serine protease Do